MQNLIQALVKVGGCAAHVKKKKRGKGMLAKKAETDPLEQFDATARQGEMAGTGLGAGTGALLGSLLARRAGGGILAPVAGAAGLGMLGKYLGRKGGEQLGLQGLEESTGVPWELS
jgi:hypothetical protein